jgi:hypothetical protein
LNITGTVDEVLADEATNDILNGLLQDADANFGLDVTNAETVVNADDSGDVIDVTTEALDSLQEVYGEDSWVSGFLGSFSEGLKNTGTERKGTREGGRRL